MVLTAVRGALGFLSRLPVGHDEESWEAFQHTPTAFPLAGYVIGALLVAPLLLPAPAPTVALLFGVWVYLVTGINHADGVADLGDALVVHGDATSRRSAMKDTTVGVGAVLSLVFVVLGVVTAGYALATAPLWLLPLVITAEVGAKLGMATIACLGTATHEGLGASLTSHARPRQFAVPSLVALPTLAATWPHPAAAVTLGASLLATLCVVWWAQDRLGGVSGDVFGASNELARVVGLHAGVIAWMHF